MKKTEKPIDFVKQHYLVKKGIQKTMDIFDNTTSLTELNLNSSNTSIRRYKNNMGSFKTEAENYEAEKMGNISDLKEVEVINAVLTETKTRDDGTSYTVKYIIANDGKQYRVPLTVLSALKEILAEKPKLKTFKVKRTGTTKEDTRYTVIPLD